MKDQIFRYLQTIVNFWKGLSDKTKKITIISSIGFVIFASILGVVLNNNPYDTLYSGISVSEATEIMAKLDELGVEYKFKNGNVEVKSNQADQVKMNLAVEGYPKSGLSYDIFTNNIDLMSTDFEKNSFKIFQLQDRLRDTIKLINGVEDAVITIAVPQENNYVWKEDQVSTTASVVLKTTTEGSISEKQIKGIVQLVSKSIPGLKAEDVAVVDTFGNDLVSENSDISTVNFSQLKLDIEKQIEGSAKTKISNVLVPIYGEKNVKISVKCIVDVKKKISESVNYIPNGDTDRGIIEKEQSNKESTSDSKSNNNVPGTESNTQVPTYPIISENGDKIYVKDQNSYEYLVSSIKEQVQSDSPEQKDMTVAIAINKESISDEDRIDIQRLVAAATAIEPEKVVVHNTIFEGQQIVNLDISQNKFTYGLIGLVATVILILIILFILISRARHKKVKNNDEETLYYNLQNKEVRPFASDTQNDFESNYKDLNNLDPTDLQQLQKNLQDLTDNNPEVVAKLLRSWLKGDEGRIE